MSGSFTDAESMATERLLQQFDDVFHRRDPAALNDLVADDCVIENTRPAPDGARYEGKQACVALWTEIATNQNIRFERQHIIARGDPEEQAVTDLSRGSGDGDAHGSFHLNTPEGVVRGKSSRRRDGNKREMPARRLAGRVRDDTRRRSFRSKLV